ncbi:hypothetical protein PCASD_05052 [Puccinia coronata f. sp. avenae]|uniref:BED-type domain-containing protein n=1 Tax=Puccinia coronata f. sp. avenae TaxID=200324 RepID=A0A2N5VG84_9BASI|nr:hypothetical protein PCASD_05052 [Puccinia coronata f. sp. avenae]
MAPTQKRRRRASKQTDDTDGPTVDSSEEQNNGNSTAPSATPVATETTDEDQLEHALRLLRNQVSTAYSSYEPPQLLDQLDKFNRRMIACQCKACGKTINRPTYDNSCSNLLTHVGQCLRKQQKGSDNRTLASVGVTGTST